MKAKMDKSQAPHAHPNWLTNADKNLVVDYKQAYPDKSATVIAREMTEVGILLISDHSVADVLKQRGASLPPFLINPPNSIV